MVTKAELAEKIREFTTKGGSCLFAGAGVGVKAELPDWNQYIRYLASVAGRYEKTIEELMLRKAERNLYLEAAGFYKLCSDIPEGEKFIKLAEPFKTYNHSGLLSLMSLNYSAVVTTNYDRSLYEAYISLFENRKESGLDLSAPHLVELYDKTMKYAIHWTEFYIARIHGRAEIPEEMVIDKSDYQKLEQYADYHDFLIHVLKTYYCMFVGYSFLDPAISHVLEVMKRSIPPSVLKKHIALLPSDCDHKLKAELASFNIELVDYSPENNHEQLWEAIKQAQRAVRTLPRVSPDKVEPMPGLQRFLSSAYARLKLGSDAGPLREIVIEGIVAQEISNRGDDGVSRDEIVFAIKKYISLDNSTLEHLVSKALRSLMAQTVCRFDNAKYFCKATDEPYDQLMEKLIDAVIDRLYVREGKTIKAGKRNIIKDALNRLFLARGWDLGAHFAGGKHIDTFEYSYQIKQFLSHELSSQESNIVDPLINSIFHLFKYPSDRESILLSDIGRIAFGVELIINNAKSTSDLQFIMPDNLYLDSNVIMPAILEGHPFQSIYMDSINEILKTSLGHGINIYISSVFVEEIVYHRRAAISEVTNADLENFENLQKYILLYGAENINVYIGAYSNWVGREKRHISFSEFLNSAAPYNSPVDLKIYLKNKGFTIFESYYSDEGQIRNLGEIKSSLYDAYDNFSMPKFYLTKPRILIDHEASQLARLLFDLDNGLKPLFLTADRRLMHLCNNSVLKKCEKLMISPSAFIQLIDLVFGLSGNSDKRALTRLMWTMKLTDDRQTIRDYLINLALTHYDIAKVKATWDLVDDISTEASKAAASENISFVLPSEQDRVRNARFLDRFEDKFFQNMNQAIKKQEKE